MKSLVTRPSRSGVLPRLQSALTGKRSGKEQEMSYKPRLPKAVYYQCVWVLKDLDRLRRLEAADTLRHSSDEKVFFVDEDELIRDAEVLEEARRKLECIRDAIAEVPYEYRQRTMDSIVYGIPFDDVAHENTWRKWRQVFIRELAKNLMLI